MNLLANYSLRRYNSGSQRIELKRLSDEKSIVAMIRSEAAERVSILGSLFKAPIRESGILKVTIRLFRSAGTRTRSPLMFNFLSARTRRSYDYVCPLTYSLKIREGICLYVANGRKIELNLVARSRLYVCYASNSQARTLSFRYVDLRRCAVRINFHVAPTSA